MHDVMRNLGLLVALVLVAGSLPAGAAAEAQPGRTAPTAAPAIVYADDTDGTDVADEGEDASADDEGVDDGTDDSTDDGFGDETTDPSGDDDGTAEEPDPRPEPASVSFPAAWVEGSGGAKRVTVGNRSTMPLTFYIRVSSDADTAPKPRLALQRRIGSGAWTTLGTAVPKPSDATGAVVVRTPAWSTTAKRADVAYRLRSSAFTDAATGGIGATTTSPQITITYDDQDRYTGMARTIWRIVRPYCPTTAVRITSLPSGAAGQYRTGGLVIEVERGVGTLFNTTYTSQQSLGLHECAHERQWLNYGSTMAGNRAMEKAAAKLFTNDAKPRGARVPYPYFRSTGFSAVEHAADCSAQAMHRGGYLGYGGYCNAKELAAGKRLLLGKRY